MFKIPVSVLTIIILLGIYAHADEIDEAMGGFDDEPVTVVKEKSVEDELLDGFDDTPVSVTDDQKSENDELLDGFD
ncbi:MAG: hypothetical protein EP216_00895, partial [Epsilonproteobacteria bacterium]